MLVAAAMFHGQRWWRTMSAQRFYGQQAEGRHTAHPVWHTGTATGNQTEEQGEKAC